MNYRNIVAPYLNNIAIEKSVEIFRKNFWKDAIPVEIEDIIELKLKIRLVPIPGFLKLTNMDALITSDWKCVYVDNNEYLDDCRYNRLRFSLAHEIGHYVMHKQIYNNFGIKTINDYYKFYRDIPSQQYSYLECQANKFASYLLIPRKVLALEMEKELKSKNDPRLKKIDRQILNSYLAKPLSKIFKVSEKALTIALEDITP
ncbi:MAG: ImmA/IrrE family metallo-endopeptidase [Candidatus Nealsonbacteria bacterium]|nr:ImmA/IrrE family metallo-endopeptidase [Candidatus Nealsonbacteria bacterium]